MITHFIGIGGIGMSGLAKLLLLKKQAVSGSDQHFSSLIDQLGEMGALIYIGHSPENLPEKGRVVVSSGIAKDNPELQDCQIPILHRSDLLASLMQGQKALVVSGTHGKTTTSSLLATVLTEAGLDPSWAVGGIVSRYQTNARLGQGGYFVAEGDESDGTHLKYTPYGLIVTNLDDDHLDFYGSKNRLIESFKTFFSQVLSTDHLFWCGDCPHLGQVASAGVSYGFNEGNQLRISSFRQEGRRSFFDIDFEGKHYTAVEIPLMGRHNALNAAAVFGLSLRLSIPEESIRQALLLATGSKRRGEVKSEVGERVIIDDYAHHPSEIKATLAGIRASYPDSRLIVAFQPHRYTRTRDCFNDFAPAFEEADLLIVTDIYAAGETPIEGLTAQKLLPEARFCPRNDLTAFLQAETKPFDVVVTMGAGDITKVSDELAQKAPRKLKVACLFGGQSGEHEISLLSAQNVCAGFDAEIIETIPVFISKKGEWDLEKLLKSDIAFPILHGPKGEDGTIQGLFEILNIPYVGCGVESSAVAMNKATTKKLALYAGVPTADFVDFTPYEWTHSLLETIQNRLTYPLFVKPVHLGSTLGVVKVGNQKELIAAVEQGFKLDSHLLVEQGIVGREIECAIFGSGPYFVSIPGEICVGGDVYDYEKKYGDNAAKTMVEAALDPILQKRAQELALAAYRAVGCDGMARVDLFLQDDGTFLLNEINPIPGFTKNSLFPKMCENSGIPLKMLLTKLLRGALR